jgi:hypothetical protein
MVATGVATTMALNERRLGFAVAVALVLALHPAAARMDVKVEFDKAFDFAAARTWTWRAEGPGDVKMARTKDDDPEAARLSAEPIIMDAVTTEMARHGLTPASGTADLTVTYYLLLSTTMSAQTMGQFLPATVAWGLPPFDQATQSIKMMNRGSLVLDLSAGGAVVWRGLAQADIKFDADAKKRESLVRQAVREMLAKYPAKKR